MPKTEKISSDPIVDYIKAKDLTEGDEFAGIYCGSYENWIVDPQTEERSKGVNHKVFIESEGLLAFNGVSALNDAFTKMKPGDWVQIIYNGKKGKKGFHDFEVYRGTEEDDETSRVRALARNCIQAQRLIEVDPEEPEEDEELAVSAGEGQRKASW